MILKIVSLFLIFMGVLAMFGKLRIPFLNRRKTALCKACGRHLIGKGPCPCGKGGRRS